MTAPLLDVRGLEKRFGAVTAAADINVRVDRGEIIGIIGANGAGKTTFVNMITGHLTPSAGEIVFRGKNIAGMSSRDIVRAGINRSFQIPQLFPDLTVRDNLIAAVAMFGGGETGFWRPAETADVARRADLLMERFVLEKYRNQPAAFLPQGARKFLDIAMVVVGEPQLVLLDEPTSGVSAEEKLEVADMLMEAFRQTDQAVLFIEHDMDIVVRYAQRVWAFYEGRIIGDGPPAVVLADGEVRRLVVGE